MYFNDGGTGAGTALYWGATFGLLVLLQGFTGWTIGKLLTGIRVVREDGKPPGFVKALVRWLLWIVDGFPYVVPLVGFIVGLTTVGPPPRRRHGGQDVRGELVGRRLAHRRARPHRPAAGRGRQLGRARSPLLAGGRRQTTPTRPGGVHRRRPPRRPRPLRRPHRPGPRLRSGTRRAATYIQWDPTQNAWMQWNDGLKTWSRIPGQ